ncbi:MAG: hypothetical protein F6K62_02690 [Sphaerospermopsis sp. SIO1G2]|nr:hypothetical protein [Sphaerospermopsis sp. SIO1G1]NET69980.1 hypothetical protein [Sphaerospermopsis sp. SIO1G2]
MTSVKKREVELIFTQPPHHPITPSPHHPITPINIHCSGFRGKINVCAVASPQ